MLGRQECERCCMSRSQTGYEPWPRPGAAPAILKRHKHQKRSWSRSFEDCEPTHLLERYQEPLKQALRKTRSTDRHRSLRSRAVNPSRFKSGTVMRILLYNPDNGVTRNFMPHLWMFLLKSLTPPGHEVLLIDGNAQPMDELQIAQYVRDENIGLVGIGAMTRMIAKAYRIADAIRATGVPVVMGGPHVTELADEALGRDGGPRHADAVALGEADETWPQIVNDAARGELKAIYAPVDAAGKDKKPSLKEYPVIPWQSIDLAQFNLVPMALAPLLNRVGTGWGSF